jgi:hypothetical protein
MVPKTNLSACACNNLQGEQFHYLGHTRGQIGDAKIMAAQPGKPVPGREAGKSSLDSEAKSFRL